ncbi:class I SAM-dependent methyltransferase [Aquabacterium sp. A7-Y]|uniref:class I SAM-dependent methyltransferase n=1 Tax=Aquabacterium sp. A7-Y TaxID=1349605 RepID=UPI00223DADBD|nr:class I SAM-dependent methyltransferase [Aquabacterium sp. A7-Y]MCW7536880.1 class I SAM-dependent methyltransferase [Aquabacterium sp. A7-Y]
MEETRPSRTAWRVATLRAQHQLLDDEPKVFVDPVSLRILGEQEAARLRRAPGRPRGKMARRIRADVVARSRIAEEALDEAVRRGVRQYVVLGAGLDTFAYRNPYPASQLRVFEVDHPATQAWKRQLLDQAGIEIPASLTFTPVDFESQTLAERLRAAGWRAEEPVFFSWLGVTVYLTPATVRGTLQWIAQSTARGSGIVFDHLVPPASMRPGERWASRLVAWRCAWMGEPWHSYFDAGPLMQELHDMGYAQIESLGAREINGRLFGGRVDDLRFSRMLRLMKAQV